MAKVEDIHLRGNRASQPTPAAGAIGVEYYVTDEGVTERWSGTAWEDVSDTGTPASSISTPTVIQKVSTTSLTPTIAAAAAGHSIILGFNGSNAGATAVASTNTTWTKLHDRTSAGGAHYQVWVGVVAGGASGTTVTITCSAPFHVSEIFEVTDTLTGTVGNTYGFDVAGASNGLGWWGPLTGATAGRLVIFSFGTDNSSFTDTVIPAIPYVGNIAAVHALAVGYAVSGDIGALIQSNSNFAGSIQIVEVS